VKLQKLRKHVTWTKKYNTIYRIILAFIPNHIKTFNKENQEILSPPTTLHTKLYKYATFEPNLKKKKYKKNFNI